MVGRIGRGSSQRANASPSRTLLYIKVVGLMPGDPYLHCWMVNLENRRGGARGIILTNPNRQIEAMSPSCGGAGCSTNAGLPLNAAAHELLQFRPSELLKAPEMCSMM